MRARKIENSKERSKKTSVLAFYHAYKLVVVSYHHADPKFIEWQY